MSNPDSLFHALIIMTLLKSTFTTYKSLAQKEALTVAYKTKSKIV